jgi:MoaA/NifB/PqqE/SkfB family radical SAM enzyme
MSHQANKLDLIKALLANAQLIRVKPSVNWFLFQYLRKFKVINVDGRLIIHSHLPPINSKAFTRFIDEQLLGKKAGPTHAQIGLTNACHQNCGYCYNKSRNGNLMDTETIKNLIRRLKNMGVLWIGLTGGEPLLNKDIVEIVESIGDSCTTKLFTTGSSLTGQIASDLKKAGLLYVSVSIDHWEESEHDKGRNTMGAFKTALKAIEIFKKLDGIHVSVSAVLSKDMRKRERVEKFLEFLERLGIHEAWLSEVKPSVKSLWNEEQIITSEERSMLISLQDQYNKEGRMTINYLGHFESEEHFGCTSGHKMIYIDAFGEAGPCVFTPMTFGNIKNTPVEDIFQEMSSLFKPGRRCFINSNYELMKKYHNGQSVINRENSMQIVKNANFEPFSRFFRLHYS